MAEPVIGRRELADLLTHVRRLEQKVERLERRTTSYQTFGEISDPGAAESDSARIFAQDDGGGNTQLMARFPTGSAVELASASGSGDHGSLAGLSDDDHTQYLPTAGTRPMTGNLNLDSNSITNVTNLNGTAVSDYLTTADEGSGNGLDADTVDGQHASAFAGASHAADHAPGGSDALAWTTAHGYGTTAARPAAAASNAGYIYYSTDGDGLSRSNGSTWDALDIDAVDADTVDGSHAADLLARANHTGTQTASTISDFSATVQAESVGGDLSGTVAAASVTDDSHNHTLSTITDAGTAAASAATDFVAVTGDTMTGALTLSSGDVDAAAGSVKAQTALISQHPTFGSYAMFAHENQATGNNYGILHSNAGQLFLNAVTGQTMYFRINNTSQMELSTASGLDLKSTTPIVNAAAITATGAITGGSLGNDIGDLANVDETGKSNSDVLTYNSTSGNWEAAAAGTPGAHASSHITGGGDEIDGDQLDIDWNPTNYTPSTSPTEATSVDHLTAHLYGIDDLLGGLLGNVKVGQITISNATGTQAFTGVGFQPRLLVLFGTAASASAAVHNWFMGATDGTTEYASATRSDSTDGQRVTMAQAYCVITSNTSTASTYGGLSSFDSDGFTLNRVAAAIAVTANYIAIG